MCKSDQNTPFVTKKNHNFSEEWATERLNACPIQPAPLGPGDDMQYAGA